jgi:type IV pilus assembly protein PilX
MTMPSQRSTNANLMSYPHRQKGMVATLMAVIVMIATLLALLALIASVDTSNVIAGNMNFRQGLAQEAERAYTAATGNVAFSGTASESDNAAIGYSSIILTADSTRPDLPSVLTGSIAAGKPPAGVVALPALTSTANSVYYVVERLCTSTGPASNTNCIIPVPFISGGSNSNQTSDGNHFLPIGIPAYRLTTRVDGPRSTSGYVQTVLR